jgi:predicted NUDIX family NTP pyrophosphohydrolase
MYRFRKGRLQVFLAHPGGSFFGRKDDGFWTIPKGEPDAEEDLLEAAIREFQEETGVKPTGPYIPLKPVKQKGGKLVHAWAFEGDYEEGRLIVSNTFTIEWPPWSGRVPRRPTVAHDGALGAAPDAANRRRRVTVACFRAGGRMRKLTLPARYTLETPL